MTAMNCSPRSPLVFALCAAFGLGATVSCYTVNFDEDQPDVFYCVSADDCGASQACWEFRCVDDSGPVAEVTAPEKLQNVANGTTELTVSYNFENFEVSDANTVVEGQGRVHVSIAGTDIAMVSQQSSGAVLDISSLRPGAHRVRIQALYGDGTPYTNPSATLHQVFYLEDENTERPQAAIVFPYPGYKHIVGEPLEVIVAARGFDFVETGEDCRVDPGCDPWGADADTCLPACTVNPSGHPHIYLLDDYPGCLTNQITCNGDYIQSLRPTTGVTTSGTTVSAMIPADRFDEVGEFTFSTGLQYNDHEPYPNVDFIVFDQITISVGER